MPLREISTQRRLWLGSGFIAQAVGFVVPAQRGVDQAVFVLLGVVGAEQQLTGGQGDSDIRLRATAVAVVAKAEGFSLDSAVDGGGSDSHPVSSRSMTSIPSCVAGDSRHIGGCFARGVVFPHSLADAEISGASAYAQWG